MLSGGLTGNLFIYHLCKTIPHRQCDRGIKATSSVPGSGVSANSRLRAQAHSTSLGLGHPLRVLLGCPPRLADGSGLPWNGNGQLIATHRHFITVKEVRFDDAGFAEGFGRRACIVCDADDLDLLGYVGLLESPRRPCPFQRRRGEYDQSNRTCIY